ncbi:MAG TPA: hypothetical protein VKD72_32595 [Gemmataceae bacterium]|nr:hypothetical protein [Gemmataceae bacterium]
MATVRCTNPACGMTVPLPSNSPDGMVYACPGCKQALPPVPRTPPPTRSARQSFFSGADDVRRRPRAPAGTLALLILLVCLVGAHLLMDLLRLATSRNERWEYRVDVVPDTSFKAELDLLGHEGWELVFARRAQDRGTERFSYEMIFKRRK